MPVGPLTTTSTVAAAWDGDTAVILVSELTTKLAAGTPPKVTPLAAVKPVPVMATLVPPAVLPLEVPRDDTAGAGAAVTVKRSVPDRLDVPPPPVTVTSTVPAISGGVTATITPSLAAIQLAAGTPPKYTPSASRKPLPLMFRVTPPPLLPVLVPSDDSDGIVDKMKL